MWVGGGGWIYRPPKAAKVAKNNKSSTIRKRPKPRKVINLPPSENGGKKKAENSKSTARRKRPNWYKASNLPPSNNSEKDWK